MRPTVRTNSRRFIIRGDAWFDPKDRPAGTTANDRTRHCEAEQPLARLRHLPPHTTVQCRLALSYLPKKRARRRANQLLAATKSDRREQRQGYRPALLLQGQFVCISVRGRTKRDARAHGSPTKKASPHDEPGSHWLASTGQKTWSMITGPTRRYRGRRVHAARLNVQNAEAHIWRPSNRSRLQRTLEHRRSVLSASHHDGQPARWAGDGPS